MAFLQRTDGVQRPSLESLREWTQLKLGRHKAPVHVFWLGEDGVPAEVPMTVSSFAIAIFHAVLIMVSRAAAKSRSTSCVVLHSS